MHRTTQFNLIAVMKISKLHRRDWGAGRKVVYRTTFFRPWWTATSTEPRDLSGFKKTYSLPGSDDSGSYL